MATGVDAARRERVAERLAILRGAEERLIGSLEAISDAVAQLPEGAIDRDPATVIGSAVVTLGEPLPAQLAAVAEHAGDGSPGASDAPGAKSSARSAASRRPSDAFQPAYGTLGDAAAAAAALFTTGRLMYLGEACDFADGRMRIYAGLTKAINSLLPPVIGWELREAGLPCQCICPMCGLGACGCIWASLHTIDAAWGGPGLAAPDERGIPLRSPPRPGSQLAAEGVRQWDRVTAVDGKEVRTPGELQTAMREHAIGEEVRLRIDADGESREVVVTHVSDFP